MDYIDPSGKISQFNMVDMVYKSLRIIHGIQDWWGFHFKWIFAKPHKTCCEVFLKTFEISKWSNLLERHKCSSFIMVDDELIKTIFKPSFEFFEFVVWRPSGMTIIPIVICWLMIRSLEEKSTSCIFISSTPTSNHMYPNLIPT